MKVPRSGSTRLVSSDGGVLLCCNNIEQQNTIRSDKIEEKLLKLNQTSLKDG
jgi:hypothetical protein